MLKDNQLEKANQDPLDIMCDTMIQRGYQKREVIFSPAQVNTWAVLFPIPLIALAVVLYFLRWGKIVPDVSDMRISLVIIGFLVSILVHELLHGVGWSMACPDGWRSIQFGVNWKALMPYCHCKEPLNKAAYLRGVLAPIVTLGLSFFLLSMIFHWPELWALLLLNILVGGGDLLIAWNIRKDKDVCILDHPTLPGYISFSEVVPKG